jgi:hypothetical protein
MCLGLAAQTALAGPNKGGVLLLHLAPEIQYTSDNRTYCDQFDAKSWEDVRVQGKPDPTRAQVFYVLAAFDTTHSSRFKTVGFGLSEDLDAEKIHFENWGACAMDIMEMPSKGWPGPGTGTAVFMADTVYTGLISPVYWFSAYIYDECQIKLAEYPKQVMGAFFVDDGSPPGEDKVTSFGALGFGLDGKKPRPIPWQPDESTEEPESPKSNN